MLIKAILGKNAYGSNPEFVEMVRAIEAGGHSVIIVDLSSACRDSAACSERPDLILSIGGDGTFLGSASLAASSGIPVLGVNLGHLGFLSENSPQAVTAAVLSGNYVVSERSLLEARAAGHEFMALNEVCVRRTDGAMLGVRVRIADTALPTYWADGLLVSTPSGSTAYSLSAGGPIVMPSSHVLLVVPIAPHNLNVRPLVVPDDVHITIGFEGGCSEILLSADNNSALISSDSTIEVSLAQFSLKRVSLDNTNFIKALSEKLFWGQDKRNNNER